MVDRLLAHRSQKQARESAAPPVANYQKSGTLGLLDQHVGRLTLNYRALGRDRRFQFSGSGHSSLDRAFGLLLESIYRHSRIGASGSKRGRSPKRR